MKVILLVWDHSLQSSGLEHYWEHRLWIFFLMFISIFIYFQPFFPRKRFKMDCSGEVIIPYKVPEGQKTLPLALLWYKTQAWRTVVCKNEHLLLYTLFGLQNWFSFLFFFFMLTIIYNKVKILIGFPYSRLSKSSMKRKSFVKKYGAFGIIKSSRIFKQVNRHCAYLFEGCLPPWFILCLSLPQDQGLVQQQSFKMK